MKLIKKTMFMLVIAIISLLFVLGCSSDKTMAEDKAPDSKAPDSKTTDEVEDDELPPTFEDEDTTSTSTAVNEISMVAKQWEFIPSTIKVKKGEKVKLTITSQDVRHGFAIADYGINQDLVPGETNVVEFVADKEGQFNFFCSVQCGSGHGGMNGLLIVE